MCSYVTSTEVSRRSWPPGAVSGFNGPLPSERPQREVAPQLAGNQGTDPARLDEDEDDDRDAVQPRLQLVDVLAEPVDVGNADEPAVDRVVDDVRQRHDEQRPEDGAEQRAHAADDDDRDVLDGDVEREVLDGDAADVVREQRAGDAE